MSFFFFQAEDGIRDWSVTGVQTCALPISKLPSAILVPWSSAATRSQIPRTKIAEGSFEEVRRSPAEIGRASCRERVEISVVAVEAKQQTDHENYDGPEANNDHIPGAEQQR